MRHSFSCSYDRIELVITYRCNMRCYNCDAMVSQAPSQDTMTVEQIEKFIRESINKNVYWKHIRVLGGEPTLHKQIFEILNALINYRHTFSSNTKIQLITNGSGKLVHQILAKIPKEIEIENSQKTSNIQPTFSPVNQAPIDLSEYKNNDFSKGCWIPALCGITLDLHGYYPCSAAAAIDRTFGFDLGRKELPVEKGELEKFFKVFCRLCGHYYDKINEYASHDISNKKTVEAFEQVHRENFSKTQKLNVLTEQNTSPTWQKALEAYKIKKPILTNY